MSKNMVMAKNKSWSAFQNNKKKKEKQATSYYNNRPLDITLVKNQGRSHFKAL